MINFAIEYHLALDAITGERDMKLCKYELSEMEWGIASQLRDMLKVFFLTSIFILTVK